MFYSVGQPVQYVPDAAHRDQPLAAQVVGVALFGRTVDLIYWCPESKQFKEAFGVSPYPSADGDTDMPYFNSFGDS